MVCHLPTFCIMRRTGRGGKRRWGCRISVVAKGVGKGAGRAAGPIDEAEVVENLNQSLAAKSGVVQRGAVVATEEKIRGLADDLIVILAWELIEQPGRNRLLAIEGSAKGNEDVGEDGIDAVTPE